MIIKRPVTQEQVRAKQAADKIILNLALRLNALEDKELINDDD